MSTAQSTASPRAPRGKQHLPQSPAQAPSANVGRQSQRKPRGNRAHNGHNQFSGAGTSPSKGAIGTDPALAESAVFPSEQAQMPTGPRNTKKHTHSQPSIDRVFSPNGPKAPLTDTDSAPYNPSATPAKVQGAYAGPTFHASPAPSALPIPKFLSRSVPAKTRPGPPTPPPEDSSDSANSPSLSPESPSRVPIQIPARNEDSPLDMLFRADKAERARNVRGSPASANFFSQMHPPRPPHYQRDSSNSANGIFPIELEGEGKSAHMSPPPAFPVAHRSVTDPKQVPQLKDASPQGGGSDVMQDLLNRLSMSQKKPAAATPPGTNAQANQESQRDHTPSPFHDGRSAVRSASGPTTPQPAQQEGSDFFYGNKNLSPMFKAAKNDSAKRNSGLRTEITAESPALGQAMFQDLPSVAPVQTMDPNVFARNYPGSALAGPGNSGNTNIRHPPFSPPYQYSPNNRKTPGRQQQHPRNHHAPRGNMSGTGQRGGKAFGSTQPVNVPKPTTSMMAFVPASVSAKQHSSSAPPAATLPPPAKPVASLNTSVLEQDLKRMLNLKMTGETSSVR
ncbi:hypothetical protein NX059_002031 [Plenodomus lindquistii]|nr:hypothetical protein NX059_002031 [Plenodomus lindquistii]